MTIILQTPDRLPKSQQSPVNSLLLENLNPLLNSGGTPQQAPLTKEGKEGQGEEGKEEEVLENIEEETSHPDFLASD